MVRKLSQCVWSFGCLQNNDHKNNPFFHQDENLEIGFHQKFKIIQNFPLEFRPKSMLIVQLLGHELKFPIIPLAHEGTIIATRSANNQIMLPRVFLAHTRFSSQWAWCVLTRA